MQPHYLVKPFLYHHNQGHVLLTSRPIYVNNWNLPLIISNLKSGIIEPKTRDRQRGGLSLLTKVNHHSLSDAQSRTKRLRHWSWSTPIWPSVCSLAATGQKTETEIGTKRGCLMAFSLLFFDCFIINSEETWILEDMCLRWDLLSSCSRTLKREARPNMNFEGCCKDIWWQASSRNPNKFFPDQNLSLSTQPKQASEQQSIRAYELTSPVPTISSVVLIAISALNATSLIEILISRQNPMSWGYVSRP